MLSMQTIQLFPQQRYLWQEEERMDKSCNRKSMRFQIQIILLYQLLHAGHQYYSYQDANMMININFHEPTRRKNQL